MKLNKAFILLFAFFSYLVASDYEIPIDKAKELSVDQIKQEIQSNNNKMENNNKNNHNNDIKKATNDLFSSNNNKDSSTALSPLSEANNKFLQSKKIKLKNYVGVSYNKRLEWFSILGHNASTFEKIKRKYHISSLIENKLLNSVSSPRAILYNAFLYDFKYKKPNIAENFYILFPKRVLNNRKFSFVDRKLRFADYLIRTGRPLAIFNYLKKIDCMSNIKWMGFCMYYLGVAEYFRTGDNRNNYLMVAKPYVKKARLLYNMK